MKIKNRGVCLFLVFLVCLLSFTGCLKYTSNLLEVTQAVNDNVSAVASATADYQYSQVPSSVPVVSDYAYTQPVSVTAPTSTPASQAQPTKSPTSAQATQQVTQAPQPAAAATKDPSQWSKNEIVDYLSKAVNSAKTFTGNVTVEHSEDFGSLNITDCPGGTIGKNLANSIASGVIKPTTETMNFSNGKATNSEGQSVPLLLPKRQSFTLTADGVQSARASSVNGQTIIELTLVSETSTLQQPPPHNSSAIGYLDPAEVDLSIITLNSFNVTYSGSTIKATIDAQDRVVSIDYSIPVAIEASGSVTKMPAIAGSFACNANEKETWKINWQ